jgi:predicted MFS family arabinose efflux permease
MIRLLVLTLGAFVWQTTEILPIGLLPQIAGDLRVSEASAGLPIDARRRTGAWSFPIRTKDNLR